MTPGFGEGWGVTPGKTTPRLKRIHWKGKAFGEDRLEGLYQIGMAGGTVVPCQTRKRHLWSWEVVW